MVVLVQSLAHVGRDVSCRSPWGSGQTGEWFAMVVESSARGQCRLKYTSLCGLYFPPWKQPCACAYVWRPQCTPVYLCTYWSCTDFLSNNLIPSEVSRTERRILKENCCALCISVWNKLHFHFVLFEIASYFPTAGQSHSKYYNLTLSFPYSSL